MLTTEEQFVQTHEYKAVLKKIKDSPYYRNAAQGDELLMSKLALVLSDKQKLKSFYLTTDWAQSVINAISTFSETSHSSGLGITSNSGEPSGKKKGFFEGISSKSDAGGDIAVGGGVGTTVNDDYDDDSDDELDVDYLNSPEHLEIQKTLMNQDKLRVKIIVSEICESRGKKAFRQMMSPFLAKSSFLPELGMIHASVLFGPYKFEWIDASLCVPKKLVASAALVACDLTDELSVSGCGITEMIDKIADVIIKWNTTMEYKNRGGDGKKSGNCQDFVDDILDAIGIDKSVIYQGAMGAYFERLKKKGKCGMKFFFEDAFRKKFNIPSNQKHIKFTSHIKLDLFVQQLFDIDPLFDENHPSEFRLLKSFDRAFWLRHLAKPSISQWEPLREETQGFDGVEFHLKCPFGDPRESYSFREASD